MRVTAPVSRAGRVVIDIEAGRGPSSVTFTLPPDVAPTGVADAALAAALLPAMRLGEDLEVDGPVSGRLREGARSVQDILWTWDRTLRPRDPWYRRIPVTGPGIDGPAPAPSGRPDPGLPATAPPDPGRSDPGPGPDRPRGTAAFFTGGVDSFATAVAHRQELDALVFVHGFDVPLDATALRAEVSHRLGDAARRLGLPLIEVETDLRALGDGTGVPWPDYHGAALATVALLLAPRFSRVLIPATHTYARLEGLGSHPLLDPLWSTDAVAIVHDGAEATRVDKIRRIAGEDAARRHLRVCWENPGATYNCGRCEKCVRTGVAVRIAGAEGRFPTVPAPSLAAVARARVTGRGSTWHDLRGELVRTGANRRLRRAIDLALARHQLARWSWTGRWFR